MCQHFLLWAGYLNFDKADWLCLTFLPLIPASFITPEALLPVSHPRLLVGSIYCCEALMCVCYVCVRAYVRECVCDGWLSELHCSWVLIPLLCGQILQYQYSLREIEFCSQMTGYVWGRG